MISFAKKEDLPQIISLWDKIFSGEEEFSEYFFENIYNLENTLIMKKDEKIVSMLQMLPFKSSFGDITYIYGVATDENHRKKGYALRLMEKSFEISREKGQKYSVLIPAEQWLFGFYEKMGYNNVFYCKIEEIFNENIENISEKLEYTDIFEINNIYEKSLLSKFYIKRDEKFYKHQIDLYGENSFKYIENGKIIGYSFGYFKEDAYIIEEIFSDNIKKCLNSFEKVKYKTLGSDFKIAVLKSLDEKNNNFKANDEFDDGYINLMYN